jgi:hypothetical protein
MYDNKFNKKQKISQVPKSGYNVALLRFYYYFMLQIGGELNSNGIDPDGQPGRLLMF